jgi:hypothetical protein
MRLKLPYLEYMVVCGDCIWYMVRIRILLYTAYGRACKTVFVYYLYGIRSGY